MTMLSEPDAKFPSNWGRWGADDERGTLNFITDEARARGVAEAKTARVVSLAAPVTPVPLAGPLPFGTSPTPAGVMSMMNFTGSPAMALVDVLLINTHHASLTHIDALAHVPTRNEVYPGVDIAQAAFGGTVRHGSTSAFAAGIVTRGVCLDLAPDGRLDEGHWVDGSDLDDAERRAGVRVESGDALIVRGGWTPAAEPATPVPAMTVDAVRWMAEREVSLYAGDIGDRPPVVLPPERIFAMHAIALAQLGMPLIDCVVVDALAQTCKELNRYSFLLVVAPMPVLGATGVPVNPLAIF